MADTSASSSFPASTSKICWFNLSSLLFKSSSTSASSQDVQLSGAQQQQQQQPSPVSSPSRRRTSPRLLNKNSSVNTCTAPNLSQCHEANECHCSASPSTTTIKRKHAKSQKKQREYASAKDNDSSSEDGDSTNLPCHCSVAAPSSSHGLNDHVCCQGHSHQNLDKKLTHGLSLKEAPHYLTFNPYITGGYRNNLGPVECIKRYRHFSLN